MRDWPLLIMASCIIAVVLLIVFSGPPPKCIRSHSEKIWYQPPPVQIEIEHGIMMSVPQVGYEMETEVCDEYERPAVKMKGLKQ
jgi:hypothetical protein